MSDRIEALREAYRRNLLPPDMKAAFEEAERRGLLGARVVSKTDDPKKPTVGTEATAVVSQFNKGLAQGFGAPVDAAAWIGNKAAGLAGRLVGDVGPSINPPIKDPVGGAKSIQNAMEAVGINVYEPQTTTGRIAGRAAEFTGELALPYMGAATAVRAGARGFPLVDEMLTHPGRQVAASAGAGAGSGAAQEAFPESPWAELGGILLGGVAPSAAGVAGKYATGVVQGAVEPFFQSGRERIIGNALSEAAVDPQAVKSNLAQGGELVPGSKPTTAQVAQDPGLATVERGMRSGDPQMGGQFAMRDAQQAQARRAALGDVAPTDAGVGSVSAAIRARLKQFEGATDAIIGRATERAQHRIANMGGEVDAQRAGQILREEFEAAKGAAGKNVSRLYNEVDPTDASRFQVQPLYTEIADSVNAMFGRSTSGTPKELLPILERLRNSQVVSFADLDAIAKDFGRIAGTASQSGDNALASTAGGAQKAVLDYIAKNADEGFTVDDALKYAAGRAARREKGRLFEEHASGAVGSQNRFGRYDTLDSDVAKQWFNSQGHAADDIGQFVEALGGRPKAVETLTNYAASQLREFATKADGTIDPDKWRKWMTKHFDALRPFPELVEKMRTAGKAGELVERLGGRQARAMKAVEKSAAGFFLDKDPDKAVAAVFAGDRPAQEMRALVRLVQKDPEALAGLRRSVMDHITTRMQNTGLDAAGEQVDSFAKIHTMLTRNDPVLRELYTPAQLRNMKLVLDDMKRSQFVHDAGNVRGSPTKQNLSVGNFLSRLTGGLVDLDNPALQAFTSIAQPFLRAMYKIPEEQMRDMMVEVMLDPKLAYTMMQKATPSRVREVASSIWNRLQTTYGSAVPGVMQDGGGPKSTTTPLVPAR